MKVTIKESNENKFVYHNSPDPNINVFIPKAIWRNQDWSASSAEETPEFIKDEVVFAIDKNKSFFYSLPRDVPRILLNDDHKEAKNFLGLKDKVIMLLDKKDKDAIQRYSWTQYKFDKRSFESLPTGEWASREEVRPLAKQTYKNPIEHLTKNGYKVIWVDNINKIAKDLINRDVAFDGENI